MTKTTDDGPWRCVVCKFLAKTQWDKEAHGRRVEDAVDIRHIARFVRLGTSIRLARLSSPEGLVRTSARVRDAEEESENMNLKSLMEPSDTPNFIELARQSPRPSFRSVIQLLYDLWGPDKIPKDRDLLKLLWKEACLVVDAERKLRVKFTRRERTAFHEAGHAVAAYLLHRRPTKASIIPGKGSDDTLGWVHTQRLKKRHRDEPTDDSVYGRPRNLIEREIMVHLAGDVGSHLMTGRADGARRGAGRDYTNAFSLAATYLEESYMYTDESVGYYVSWLWEVTKARLDNPIARAMMADVARALLKDREIGERRLREIMSKAAKTAISRDAYDPRD